jgi:signal transduction histidine kinase
MSRHLPQTGKSNEGMGCDEGCFDLIKRDRAGGPDQTGSNRKNTLLAGDDMQKFRGTSLKMRLYLMVLVAFIPVALLIFYIAEEQKAIEIDALYQKTLVLAQAVANEENQQLESTHTLLAAVADAFLLVNHRSEKLVDLLDHMMRRSNAIADCGVLGPDGRLLVGSASSKNRPNFRDSTWLSASLENKGLAIGPYHGEHIDGQPVIYVALPILDEQGSVVAVTFAALNLNWMNRTMFARLAELPRGSRLSMLDEQQGVLRYDVNTRQWSVPQDVSPSLQQAIATRQTGTLSTVDRTGTAYIHAFAPLSSSFRERQIAVMLEIPEDLALASSKAVFNRNVALLLATALIAVVSIWWAGERFILRRIRVMVRATRRLAAGDLAVRIGPIGTRDELSHLASVFDEMAASLQNRIEQETRAKASLEHSREQLRSLASYQNDALEQERIRIAREIHDQLGQSLTILQMDLSWLKKHLGENRPAADEKIAAMSRVISDALDDLHTVTAELRPVILDDFGLAAAIEWQVEEFRHRSGIACRLEHDGFEPDLPKDQATALFRIFQETLTNILRHAGADEVVVRLEAQADVLMLNIQDNGRGITAAEIDNPKAFGLLGIRERLYPWNGRVSFAGRPGQGTCVTVRLPIAEKGPPL